MKSAADLIPETETIAAAGAMKYLRKTWLPAVEVNLLKWMNKDGDYQLDHYLAAKKYLKNNRVAVDVGANIGLFARRMVEDFQTVHCFEPLPIARACLARNVTANNCILYSYGLGNSDYETEISYCEHSIVGSEIGRQANVNREAELPYIEHQIKLRIKKLDSFKLTNVDLIKIDIQGYEYEMLQGAIETLKSNDPVILVELETNGRIHNQVPEFLNSLGYKMVETSGKDGVFIK